MLLTTSKQCHDNNNNNNKKKLFDRVTLSSSVSWHCLEGSVGSKITLNKRPPNDPLNADEGADRSTQGEGDE